MILNQQEFDFVLKQLARMNLALESLRATVWTKNPRNFTILAESYLSDRDQLLAELTGYLQDTEATRRVELIAWVLGFYPWMSKPTAARLAGVHHLALTTQASGFPGGVEAFSALVSETTQAAFEEYVHPSEDRMKPADCHEAVPH